jgi:putative ABC transport system permease protein
MSFTTALNLSFKNLMTKKTRTILTAFAGSIGIIGIALILSLSSGMQDYVNNLERDTLSQYPIEITAISMDMGGMMTVMMEHNRRGDRPEREQNMIHANNIMRNMMRTAGNQIQRNDLAAFKAHIESAEGALFHEFSNTIKYGYDVELQIFTAGGDLQVNPSDVFARLGMGGPGGGMGFGIGGMGGNIWTEMLDNDELLRSQYDVIAGDWPSAFDELVLVVNRRNELNDMVLYSLGLLDAAEIDELMGHLMRGEEIEPSPERSFTYQEILDLTFRLLLNTDYFVRSDFNENGVGIWEDKRENEEHMAAVIENALELRVVGIIRPNENAQATSINGSVAYLSSLTEFVINAVLETEIAGEQLANPETNVFTGLAFGDMGLGVEPSAGSAGGGVNGAPLAPPTYTALPPMGDMPAMGEMPSMGDMPQTGTMPPGGMGAMGTLAGAMGDFGIEVPATFEGNLAILGVADLDNPTSIRLFPRDFDSKQRLEELIEAYNNKHLDAGNDDYVINYTDIVGLMTSSISQIINIISYVLIAFVAISLVVSSIMIAIITYISVLERTKEIGILRSIGASKRDITRVFNAETVIEGFVAGTMGIAITLILNIPINAIILNLTDITNLSVLPFYGAIALIIISIILTLIAGYIPSKMAAKKDPVVALRTE